MSKQANRNFKGIWTPKEIWLDKNLNWCEKVLLAEIDSLDGENGCWATNNYFAKFFNLTKNHISRMINSLKDKGYITVEMTYKEGTKAIDRRIIRVVKTNTPICKNADTPICKNADTPICKSADTPICKSADTPICKNAEGNNTSINNTNINNTSINNTRVHMCIDEVKELYNSICVSLPRATIVTAKRGSATRELLKNYTLEQIREVFERAEQSDFLNGRVGGRKWKANFDWLINSNNAAKVLDGNYGNKQEAAGFADFLAEMERRDSLKKIKEEGGK